MFRVSHYQQHKVEHVNFMCGQVHTKSEVQLPLFYKVLQSTLRYTVVSVVTALECAFQINTAINIHDCSKWRWIS
jgi:hypothetical protein